MHHCAEALSLFKQSQCERKSSPGAPWECFREADGGMFAPSSGSVFSVLLAMHSLSCTRGGLHWGVAPLAFALAQPRHGMVSYGMVSGRCSFPSAAPAPAPG